MFYTCLNKTTYNLFVSHSLRQLFYGPQLRHIFYDSQLRQLFYGPQLITTFFRSHTSTKKCVKWLLRPPANGRKNNSQINLTRLSKVNPLSLYVRLDTFHSKPENQTEKGMAGATSEVRAASNDACVFSSIGQKKLRLKPNTEPIMPKPKLSACILLETDRFQPLSKPI